MQMRGAEQLAAARTGPAVHGVEHRTTLITARQLRGLAEEPHASQNVLTEADSMMQS